ncbi:MAG: 4Fe-4S binding protein [Candidatus Tectomicrobia bacterium]|uniref:4Fe-4S binding protein n=1 Tax=Tectimicrobiota bacterium TaxID=2528274 RepID=A0A933GLI0_UNCTE|nr:4Fe-4S binding protein [Candidatus Tectomicrobia bacterium]
MKKRKALGPDIRKGYLYQELPIGAISVIGKVDPIKTGMWRLLRPVLSNDKCIKCFKCWIFCPDTAIDFSEKEATFTVNYDYCKGCGICNHECPVQAITMEKEELE